MNWTWHDEERTCARIVDEDGNVMVCGVNLDPLRQWIEDGGEPAPFEPFADA